MSLTRKAVVGAFLVGGLLLFAVALFLIGDRRLLFARRFELNTTFTKVSGLQAGTKVRVAGLDAGEVLEILIPSRPSDPFRVRMRLREDLRPLVRADSVCGVQTDGIVGNAYIQVGRGSDGARLVADGDTIRGEDPIEFADLIAEGRNTFKAVTRQVDDLRGDLSRSVDALASVAASANSVIAGVSTDVQKVTAAATRVAADSQQVVTDARGIVGDIRAGKGTIGQLLNDDEVYKRWAGVAREAEQAATGVRATIDRAKTLMDAFASRDGAAQQIAKELQGTLADTREVMSDLSEGTEALKRNFLFRGFFRNRGFFDLDTVSREAYAAGALEGKNRTALRIWIDAAGLFGRAADGVEQLTDAGKKRIDAAMADLVRYPRDSPLVVEGYADPAEGTVSYLVSSDRAQVVRDYLVDRFHRRVTLTGIMPMSDEAPGSPRGDDRWSGVALSLFVQNTAFGVRR